MEYKYLKEQLLSMFDSDKLHLFPEEWGFLMKRKGILSALDMPQILPGRS